ncbi:MAG: fibronectin type III domain-containing protein [Planctomycetota bacterium]|nr:fibronectin type III domain-containing protein [Planctomycetota bacterium]
MITIRGRFWYYYGIGRVIAYKIKRHQRPEGAWQDVATAIETESTLVDQPLKTQLEYRVIAINKSGEGQASNTVMVVL